MADDRLPRTPRDSFDFEGAGTEAEAWLDRAYGTSLRLAGEVGTVSHARRDHGSFAVDHLRIESAFEIRSDPMPALVVVDMIGGELEHRRDDVVDRSRDGESVLVSGWDMPFSSGGDDLELRATSLSPAAIGAAVEEFAPDHAWHEVRFDSFVPRSAAAGARWRATVDRLAEVGSGDTVLADPGRGVSEAALLLGHTLLDTFPNSAAASVDDRVRARDARDATPTTVRRAQRVIEADPTADLSLAQLARACDVTPRGLQLAFRRHLGCTPRAYLRRVRLDLVRQCLRDGTCLTVADAGARYGFHNPGRLAIDYRELFREYPSVTLARGTR